MLFSETWPAGYCRAVVCRAGLCWPGYPGCGVGNEKDAPSLLCARPTTAGGILEGRQERKRCTQVGFLRQRWPDPYPDRTPAVKKMHSVCFAPAQRQRAVSWRGARNEKDAPSLLCARSTTAGGILEGRQERKRCTKLALRPPHDSGRYPGGVPGTKKMHPVCFAPAPRQRAVSWRSARNEKDTLNKIMLDSTLKFPHVEGVFLRFPCACQVIPEKISVAVI